MDVEIPEGDKDSHGGAAGGPEAQGWANGARKELPRSNYRCVRGALDPQGESSHMRGPHSTMLGQRGLALGAFPHPCAGDAGECDHVGEGHGIPARQARPRGDAPGLTAS